MSWGAKKVSIKTHASRQKTRKYLNTQTLAHKHTDARVDTWPHLSSPWAWAQSIGVEIAAHEATVEDMKRRNVANMPPAATEGKAARSGTMLEQLQVHTATSSPPWWPTPATFR